MDEDFAQLPQQLIEQKQKHANFPGLCLPCDVLHTMIDRINDKYVSIKPIINRLTQRS